MTPTQRSLKHLRDQGYIAEVVEKTIPRCFIKRDLFQFADIVAVKPSIRGILFVQTTSGSNASARVNKIKATASAGICLAAGNAIVVHGWAKRGAKGKRKTWQLREINISDTITQPTDT